MSEDMIPTNEAEADQLLSQVENPSTDAISQPQDQSAATSNTPETGKPPVENKTLNRDFEDEIMWRGQLKKLPYAKIKSYAQQAYDYNEKMRDYHSRQLELEKRSKELEHLKQYSEVDVWAKEHPELFDQILNGYRTQSTQVENDPIKSKLSEIEKTVQSVNEFVKKQQELEKQQQIQKEDEALNQNITEVREEFPHFDWNSHDQTGLSLEDKVIQHAATNSIGSFRAAFLDLHYKDLMKKSETNGKEQAAESLQKTTKLGLGKLTPQPRKQIARATNVREQSYHDITQEALRELGIH